MRLDTKQKIFIILSIVLFFVWIGTMTLLTQTDYKGSLTNATFTACVGCVAALALYIMVFSGKYRIKTQLNEQNSDKVNSNVLNAYIGVLYVDIIGFFMMSCASLMTKYDQKEVRKFNLVGLAVLLTMLALAVVVTVSCLKISAQLRRYSMQEQNDKECESEDAQGEKAQDTAEQNISEQ